jgi:hypothetical protein
MQTRRAISAYFVHQLLRARDFQDRPELSALCDWWRSQNSGVCALVGIGGAGKTALVERFLRIVPGVLADEVEQAKDATLPIPGAVFVFSFYDVPNPQVFLAQLCAWLKEEPYLDTAPRPSYHQTLEALSHFRADKGIRLLLCLDGLEKIQDDGLRGGVFGEIQDGALKDLVGRIANGYLPNLSAVITTRFPIASLEEDSPANYVLLPVDDLEAHAAIKLLRQRQVNGTDAELQRVAENCGYHALTVDLVGGYLKQFRNGDPNASIDMPSRTEVEDAMKREPNARRRRFLKQTLRFSRVAERYREELVDRDPVALAILERICLFRLPVQRQMFESIFLGPGKEGISGLALAQLSEMALQIKLNWLRGRAKTISQLRVDRVVPSRQCVVVLKA